MDSDIQDYINTRCERYLSFRPRTEHELRTYIKQKLIKKGIADPNEQSQYIENKISDLQEAGHINDEEFTRWYVAEKNYFKPRGRIRLRHELAQKGVPNDIINTILEESEIKDAELINKLLSTKFSKVDLSDTKDRNKMIQQLQRLGFAFGDIKTAIEDFTKKE